MTVKKVLVYIIGLIMLMTLTGCADTYTVHTGYTVPTYYPHTHYVYVPSTNYYVRKPIAPPPPPRRSYRPATPPPPPSNRGRR